MPGVAWQQGRERKKKRFSNESVRTLASTVRRHVSDSASQSKTGAAASGGRFGEGGRGAPVEPQFRLTFPLTFPQQLDLAC